MINRHSITKVFLTCSLFFTLATSTQALIAIDFDRSVFEFEPVQVPGASLGCKVAGCSSEMCVPLNSPITDSLCIVREEATCLQHARCEIQPNGHCGWTQTLESQACQGNTNPNQPLPTATPTIAPTPTPTPASYSLRQRRHTRESSSFEQSSEVNTNIEQSDDQGEVSQSLDPRNNSTTNQSSSSSDTSTSPFNRLRNLLDGLGSQLLFPFLTN